MDREDVFFTDENEEEFVQVEGIVEHVTYHNEENGYSVCDLSINDEELITIVGIMPFVAEGESVKATGKWVVHPTFGRQFKVEYCEKSLPRDAASMLKYLSSRAIKGVGPSTAAKIVEKFGNDTFSVLEKNPEFLAQINGISMKKALEIGENFNKQFGMHSTMMFCRDFFGPITSIKIYKKWGAAAVDIIKQNPYILCDAIYGIGFERADRVARSLGLAQNSEQRIRAGTKYILSYNAAHNGHVFIPKDKLVQAVSHLLEVTTEEAETALSTLLHMGEIVSVPIHKVDCIYLKDYYEAEKYIIKKLEALDRLNVGLDEGNVLRFIEKIEYESGITYAPLQKKAITLAANSGVIIFTGGPGTGKTTIIRAVIQIFERIGEKIALAAPTGRAAKRMSEATGMEAKTIHRMLEMEYTGDGYPKFRRNEENLLDEKVIIIDEASMVDTQLFCALLKAIKPGSRLIIIGDADQLPSIGPGNVLNDLIASDRFNTVKLKEIYRQARESLIVTNAHAINKGEYPILSDKNNDFFFIHRETDEEIADTIASLCSKRLPKSFGEEVKQNIQVITPSRKGSAGTEMLNLKLQAILNPPSPKKAEKKTPSRVFRVGDKVMQTKNNYDIVWHKDGAEGVGIFNGDIGTVLEINHRDEYIRINFDDRITDYDFSLLDELEHAYAITVHKSQGSEYPIVIIPAYTYTPKLLTRELLYTAVTRAQKMVIIVGRAEAIKMMVDNNRRPKRYTGLKYFLSQYDN